MPPSPCLWLNSPLRLELRCGRLSLGLQVAPLITERDIFLSLTMKASMAVNGCRRVVGVIGKVEQPCSSRATALSLHPAWQSQSPRPARFQRCG